MDMQKHTIRRGILRRSLSHLTVAICILFVGRNLYIGKRSILSTDVILPDRPTRGLSSTTTTTIGKDHNVYGNWSRHDHRNSTVDVGGTVPSSPSARATVIDPLSLKRDSESFLNDYISPPGGTGSPFWSLMENYPLQTRESEANKNPLFFYYEHDVLSSELICGVGPGRGMEQDAGFKLLTEKIRILASDATSTSIEAVSDERAEPTNEGDPKLLCIVYTYSPMRHLQRAQALTWGRHCDGYVAFSNETLPELGIYQLPDHQAEESYDNMWQKVRGIWKHIHDHFLDDFDYFYVSGDDVYLLVNNLKAYLRELDRSDPQRPRHFGSWLPERSMVAGGPGYVLNRVALQQYVGHRETTATQRSAGVQHNTTESVWSSCFDKVHRSEEDRYMSQCLSSELGIWGNATDTRDVSTGEQRFHDADPATLFLFRAAPDPKHRGSSYFSRMAKTWEDQPLPVSETNRDPLRMNAVNPKAVGPKHELEAAARHSISLHRIYTPTYMLRIHAILHPGTCPIDSPLGKGLKQHFVP